MLAEDAHRASKSKAMNEWQTGVAAALKANKKSNPKAYWAHTMEMQAQAELDAEATARVNAERAW